MRSLAFFFLFLICSPGFAQSDTLNYLDSLGKRQGHWIITGSMKKDARFTPGAKAEEGRYANGLKTGLWIEYYPDGKKKSELMYAGNRPNGTAVLYTEKGAVMQKGTWRGTRWTGDYWMYYENDTVVRQRFHFNSMGQRDSMQLYYHPNGVLWITGEYRNGKQEGWHREYDTTGRLYRERWYNAGVEDTGKIKTYPPVPGSNGAQGYRDGYQRYGLLGTPAIEVTMKAPQPTKTDSLKNTPAELSAIRAAYDSTASDGWPKNKNIDGAHVLYKDGRIAQKGYFEEYKLICGVKCVYDANGKLQRIQCYKEGNYIGDAPLPE
jgi:antitoxin component YwqK of YwqJK toxin-antitoxin module